MFRMFLRSYKPREIERLLFGALLYGLYCILILLLVSPLSCPLPRAPGTRGPRLWASARGAFPLIASQYRILLDTPQSLHSAPRMLSHVASVRTRRSPPQQPRHAQHITCYQKLERYSV